MKRKLVFLSALEATKEAVDSINSYFDKGYEIEEVLDADCGYYIFLVLKGDENYKYTHKFDLSDSKYPQQFVGDRFLLHIDSPYV